MIRPSMRRHLGGVLAVAGVLGVLALLLVGGIRERWAARRAFPTLNGEIAARGLASGVSIFRDEHGIPHAEARTRDDAFFALGFLHAQDRLAQMSWLLRLARGRSAEVIGAEGLPADRLARALNFAGAAETDLSRLSAGARAALEAYADGVNAGIDEVRRGAVAAPIGREGAMVGAVVLSGPAYRLPLDRLHGLAPRVIEEGGTSRIRSDGILKPARFLARPHLGPAFKAELPKLPQFFKDMIRK